MASKCRKFVPNMFNKKKCQNCFAAKEIHSAEALENNKISRKVYKCGYLFLSPDFDFNNPLDKSRRWQRRFFVLYDDAELSFSVDENPDTIPQGSVDMNKCIDVKDAEQTTTHPFSLAIVTQDKTYYIKGSSKEEISWWYDVLIVYPRNLIKPKIRHNFILPSHANKENVQPKLGDMKSASFCASSSASQSIVLGRFEVEHVKSKEHQPFATYRGVRNMKHKTDKQYQDGLRKSSSLHDLSLDHRDSTEDLTSSKFLSQSGDRLNYPSDSIENLSEKARILAETRYTNPYFTIPRRTWEMLATNLNCEVHNGDRRGSFDEKSASPGRSKNSSERSKHSRERSASLKEFSTQLALVQTEGSNEAPAQLPSTQKTGQNQQTTASTQNNLYDSRNNETDELKMAKSSESLPAARMSPSPQATPTNQPSNGGIKYEDLMYMKKGWLIKQGTSQKDWKKHWFVLTGNSLRYYKDAKAEESNSLDGRIDLSTCFEISEVEIARNYGFRIKTRNGEYILSAMTSGIRNNWMKAIRLCMDLQNSAKRTSASLSELSRESSPRTVDDLDLNASMPLPSRKISAPEGQQNSATNTKGDNSNDIMKKEGSKNVRRHYSDVNPGNVSKMLTVKEMLGVNIDSMMAVTENANQSSQEEIDQLDANFPSDAGMDPYWLASNLSMVRYVEGSENTASTATSSDNASRRSVHSESRKEEEERRLRAKSPSARIKEKSRNKLLKISSLSQSDDLAAIQQNSDQYYSDDSGSEMEDCELGASSGTQGTSTDKTDDNLLSTTSSHGDGALVNLLESEVESLKERLEKSEVDLVNVHETNIELKNRLQAVVREKDSVQVQKVATFKRQLKDARDTLQRQKTEIDSLRSKLEISESKLAGTEKALSEALRELKTEKDKYMKLNNDWNRRSRNLETQVKDSNHKLERNHDTLMIKEKECRRLEMEVKAGLQKIRDREREILKLKAVEHEYKQTKERLDEMERQVSNLKSELKEKELRCKKIEKEYEQQLDEIEHDYAQERDDLEQHLEELRKQLSESQRKTTVSDSITHNIADIIREKDEIVAQLEEKLIETDRKMVDMAEELQAEVDENTDLQQNIEVIQDERENLQKKLGSIEQIFGDMKSKLQLSDTQQASFQNQIEELREENATLGEKLGMEKMSAAKLNIEKSDLQFEVHELTDHVQTIQRKISEDRNIKEPTSERMNDIIKCLVLDSEVREISNSVHILHENLDSYITETGRVLPDDVSNMIDDVGRKCENLQTILKEGVSTVDYEMANIQFSHTVTVNSGSSPQAIMSEYHDLKDKFDRAVIELKRLHKEVDELYEAYDDLEVKDSLSRERIEKLESDYKHRIEQLSKTLGKLNSQVHNFNPAFKAPKKSDKSAKEAELKETVAISDEIESQLNELETRISLIEKFLGEHNSSLGSINELVSADSDSDEDSDEFDEFDTSSDEEEEGDTKEMSISSVASETRTVLMTLQEMKHQLEMSNSRIKDLTVDLRHDKREECPDKVDGVLQQALKKCGEKIDSLTSRIADKVKTMGANVPIKVDGSVSELGVAFNKCLRETKEKLYDISFVLEHERLSTKCQQSVKEKLKGMMEYLDYCEALKEPDWEIIGKMAKQEAGYASQIVEKERTGRRRQMSQEEKLYFYADRLSFEAVILGQLASLIQNQQYGILYRDMLLCEIQNINCQILTLEQRVDSSSKDIFKDTEIDMYAVSSYATMLAERIVLEGQLASCTVSADDQNTDDSAILSALQIPDADNPMIVAVEVLLRSEVDTAIQQQLEKSAEHLEKFTGHIITRALLQGEITHALKWIKSTFVGNFDLKNPSHLILKARDFSIEQTLGREKALSEIVRKFEEKYLSLIIGHVNNPDNKSKLTLDALSIIVSELFNEKIQEFKDKEKSSSMDVEKQKWQHVIHRLESDLSFHLPLRNEVPGCDIDSVPIDTPIEAITAEFAGILIQKSIICGLLTYICELNRQHGDISNFSISQTTSADGEVSGFQKAKQGLCQVLFSEASNKQTLAASIKHYGLEPGVRPEGSLGIINDLLNNATELVPHLDLSKNYAEILVREAAHQAQLSFMAIKLRLQHENQFKDLKLKLDSGQKVDLPSELQKQVEQDIPSMLSVFEEILETKFEDECEVLCALDKELKNLHVDSDLLVEQVNNFNETFEHELSVTQERHDIHLDVLRQEISRICIHMESMLIEQEKQKERVLGEMEERIVTLQDELDCVHSEHQEELDQVKQDIMTAVSAIKANDELSETQQTVELREMNKYLLCRQGGLKSLLEDIQKNMSDAPENKNLRVRILSQLQILSTDEVEEPEQEEVTSPVAKSAPVFVLATEEDYCVPDETELVTEQIEDAADGTVAPCMEISHHEHQLAQLKKEKEEALADEMKTTKAALDAMRKAYEEDVEVEREKYREALKTMCTMDYVDEIRRQHDEQTKKLSDELKQLAMHYDSKNEDYKLMEDRLQRTKNDYEGHISHLTTSNEQLNQLVYQEIEKLKEFIQTRSMATIPGNATIEEELFDAQIMVRVKDAELQKLRSQVKNLENNLQRTEEEQRLTMTQYLQLMKKFTELQKEQKSKESEDIAASNNEPRRSLRRTPSFHQRARSPSPQSTSTPRKDDEHHSRDSHRRRHLAAKDLRRSKSSPSLPYVFDVKSLIGKSQRLRGLASESESRSTKTIKSPRA